MIGSGLTAPRRLSVGRMGLTAIGALLAAVATTGWAQSTDFEEMVVSVRKRDESLQDVPVAVGVYNEEALLKLNITSLQDVSRWDTSVTFDQGFAAQDTRITIRGVSNAQDTDQATAFHVDGIYQNRSQFLTSFTFFDVQQSDLAPDAR